MSPPGTLDIAPSFSESRTSERASSVPGTTLKAPSSDTKVTRLRSRSALAEHSDAWREFCEMHGGAIEHSEWLDACLADGPAAEILSLFEAGRLSAVAPLWR